MRLDHVLLALGIASLAACGGSIATHVGPADSGHEDSAEQASSKTPTGSTDGIHPDAAAAAPSASPSGPPGACAIPAYLVGDAGASHACFAARALVVCQNVMGCTEVCLSPDFTSCPAEQGGGSASCSSSSGPDTKPETCSDSCGANEYAVTCDDAQGPGQPGASISPPADCHAPSGDEDNPETTSYCCPCGD
jgi:hypothetical protein